MQTPNARTGSEAPRKISSGAVRKLKTSPFELDSASPSSQTSRTPKEKSPKVVTDRRSPRSPASEKKRPSRISELESLVSQLQEDLKKSKDKLTSFETSKQQAQQEAEQSQKQLLELSSKLEDPQKQILNSEESPVSDLKWKTELDSVQKQHSADTLSLVSAEEEIQRLRVELEMVAESEAVQTKKVESAKLEIKNLKGNLAETMSIVETMKSELKDSKESEAEAKEMVSETLQQLGNAKATMEALRAESMKTMESYDSIVSELDQSRAYIEELEGLMRKLETDLVSNGRTVVVNPEEKTEETNRLEEEIDSLRSEAATLSSALEIAERTYQEEQEKTSKELKSANEAIQQVISGSGLREMELEAELGKAKSVIEELKANVMYKETELQSLLEEKEGLSLKLKKDLSSELKKLKEELSDTKGNLMDKETELQSILEENEILKEEIEKREAGVGKLSSEAVEELEIAKEKERDALVKVHVLMEEVDRSNKKSARVSEQLAAAQATGSEMESELRRLKVQSDQWRKAAEAAAAMLSVGHNGKLIERAGSMDSCYNPGRMGSPYGDDVDDDMIKKKNGNVLKKFGVLWKKQQK